MNYFTSFSSQINLRCSRTVAHKGTCAVHRTIIPVVHPTPPSSSVEGVTMYSLLVTVLLLASAANSRGQGPMRGDGGEGEG